MNAGDIFLSPRVSLNSQLRRTINKLTPISRHTRPTTLNPLKTPHHRPLPRRSFTIFCNSEPNPNTTPTGDDFITRVLTQNPTQVEPKYLVGDKLLTLKEKERLANGDSNPRGLRIPRTLFEKLGLENDSNEGVAGDVYLKDILRKFKGKLYVPEEVFRVNLSEEEAFDRDLEELPRMGYEEFVTAMEKDKVEMLRSRAVVEGMGSEYGYREFVVELREVPGDKSLQRRRWAMKLDVTEAAEVLEQYTGPQYEIESRTSTSYVGKLPRHPHPVASSISSRMMVELGMLTALMVTAAAVVGGFLASAAFAVTSFVFFAIVYVAWPLAKPIVRFAYGLSFGVIERIWDNIYDAFVAGNILTRMKNFFTFGGSTDSVRLLATILFIFVTMVILIRFTLSRRPKNFKTWDIWQGIQFGQSKANARVDGSTGVSFSDVAGIDEAVDELQELVRYLKNPELFDKMGIKPPHGVLLAGPPGCGKTLVAKAIAGEAGVPFYQMAGSEFVEVLVGVGSARIRDLFKRAKVNKPSVIFIDEIDALATRRQGIYNKSTNYIYNAATQERETTLNQLLIELDGFDTGKGVIFLGATNRMDLLDPALLRPGRFDRKIRIRPPGTKGRLDILKVHARKVKMSPTVDLSSYAQNLPGWSGAKLAQLLQESALVAVRRGHKSILQADVDDAVDRLTVGPKCLAIELGHQGQCRRATTEVGTAMVSHLLRRQENAKVELCQRISINPRGQTLSQIVFRRQEDEAYEFERRPQLLHRLQVLLGGRAAEEVIYGRDTSRASVSYLAHASWLARKILTIWNLEKPMTIHGEPPPWRKKTTFVGPKLGSLYKHYGFIEPPINFNMDDEVVQRTEELISEMYERVSSLLRRHHAALLKTVKVILDQKEITGEQLDYILDKYPAGTPIQLILEEDNPGSLPIFEAEQGRDLELSELTPSNGNFIS